MNRDLGVWTYENSALVLIDYQGNERERGVRSGAPVHVGASARRLRQHACDKLKLENVRCQHHDLRSH